MSGAKVAPDKGTEPMTEQETAVLVEAVKAHALRHYEQNGWDMVVECFEDSEIAEEIKGCTTELEAVARMASIASAYDEQRSAVRAEIF